MHTLASNYADSFIYMCQAVSHLEAVGSTRQSEALVKHKEIVENRRNKI
jgi:hypothetical protein